jgi:molybdenum cofactor synthesis domain-containing protein
VSHSRQPTAHIVIIGNEVLSGKVRDANGPYLLQRLRQLGLRCTALSVVPDVEETIAATVRGASAAVDWVFTTGGVGPTHDDVTMKSVALAFDLPLEEHETFAAFLRSHPTRGDNPERLRMAQVPAGAHVDLSGVFPQVRVNNVWIFPGVPKLLQRKFELVAPLLDGVPMHCSAVYSSLSESDIALRLEAVVDAWPQVEVGSYPQWLESGYRVLITLESLEQSSLQGARKQLVESLATEELIEVVESYSPGDFD